MKKILILLITMSVFGTLLLNGCVTVNTPKLRVATSTSLMTYIVQQVGGSNLEIFNIVPPNQHPGNFDIQPQDMQTLANARLFLIHGWPGETYVDKLVTAAANPDLQVIKATADGNWMIPSVQSAATDKVSGILSEVDPDNASDYRKASSSYKQRISAKETDVKNKLASANVAKINVIASVRQADFLTWAGFNVVATFVSPQSLTPQLVKELVDKGKAGNVTLIVNNLQDGENAGKAIAEELGAKNLNLSNFPGGFPTTETWEKAIDYNVKLLLDAIR